MTCEKVFNRDMTQQLVRNLTAGQKVASVDDVTFDQPLTVTSVRTVNLKGKTVPVFIMLDGGRFWTTGTADKRTCVVAS